MWGKIMKVSKKRVKIVLVLVASIYFSYTFISQQVTISRIKKNIADRKKEYTVLQQKNQALQDEIKLSKNDVYTEKLARERLGLIKQNETPVINVGDKQQ